MINFLLFHTKLFVKLPVRFAQDSVPFNPCPHHRGALCSKPSEELSAASGTVSRLFNVNELLALAVIAPPQPRTLPTYTSSANADIEWCSGVLLVLVLRSSGAHRARTPKLRDLASLDTAPQHRVVPVC